MWRLWRKSPLAMWCLWSDVNHTLIITGKFPFCCKLSILISNLFESGIYERIKICHYLGKVHVYICGCNSSLWHCIWYRCSTLIKCRTDLRHKHKGQYYISKEDNSVMNQAPLLILRFPIENWVFLLLIWCKSYWIGVFFFLGIMVISSVIGKQFLWSSCT